MKGDSNGFQDRQLKVCCIGAGYVGGPTSAVIALKCPNVQVTVVDKSAERIDAWKTDNLPIKEPGLLDVVKSRRGKNLHFSNEVESHVANADLIFICVNTPTKKYGIGMGRAADLTTLELAARMVADCCREPKVVVEKSTVPVQAADRVAAILNTSNSASSIHHVVLSNPEFLAEGSAIKDLTSPDRVLIGGDESSSVSRQGLDMLCSIYEQWVPKEKILRTSVWSSELSKLTANAFLAQRISSINSISAICEATGADIREVSRAVGMDTRLGSQFLQASLGFGGSCFKKDILNLTYIAETLNLHEVAKYWNSVIQMNDYQTHRFSRTIHSDLFNNLCGKRVAIFGFAFKKDTGDTRESAAIQVCFDLLNERAKIAIYDPLVEDEQIFEDLNEVIDPAIVKSNVEICRTPESACANAHAIVICTEWDEFKKLDYEHLYHIMKKPSHVFDGRLILDHRYLQKIGFKVKAIGICLGQG